MIRTKVIVLAIATAVFASGSVANAQTSDDRLGEFYADEFRAFNAQFEGLVEQLDKCLKEMDRYEKGDWLMDPVECSTFNEMDASRPALLNDIDPVLDNFSKTLKRIIERNYSGNAYDQAFQEYDQLNALLQLYMVKTQQAKIQTERVRKHEAALVKELEGFFEGLGEIGSGAKPAQKLPVN